MRQVADAAAAFYKTSSFGQLRLHVDVTRWLPAFQTDPGCRIVSVSTLEQAMQPARLAAQAAGYDVGSYDEVMYAVAGSRCGFFGMTEGHEVLLTREPSLELLVHELGHTFGLGHARASLCTYGCTLYDPGDPFSPMGTGKQLIDFSAYEKVLLGWLAPQPHISVAGRRALTPPSRAAKSAHAMVIDTAQGQYWLEYRSQPFKGMLVRFVDAHQPPSTLAPSSTLIISPVRRGRDWVALGETYRAEKTFKVRLVTASLKQAQIRFAWTDRSAPSAPYLLEAESENPAASGTHLDWNASTDNGSGIAYYAVQVDTHPVVRADATQATLSQLSRGEHTVSVVAVDRAGNRSSPGWLRFVVS